jgi:membrane-associated protease RseP (regulator of RpoE activity)
VVSGGPADEAGLRVGDIIVGLNGKEVGSGRQFAAAVADLTAGDTIVLRVWRSAQLSEIPIRTAHSPVIPPPSTRLTASSSSASELINVHPLSSEARRLLGTNGYLLVLAISERAAEAGLEVGDILLAVNEKPVRTSGELRLALSRRGTWPCWLTDMESVCSSPFQRPIRADWIPRAPVRQSLRSPQSARHRVRFAHGRFWPPSPAAHTRVRRLGA